MKTETLLLAQLAVLVFLFVLHLTGQLFFLQWRLWWFDLVLHGLGGVWVALAALWFVRRYALSDALSSILGIVLVVAISWELFEVLMGMPHEDNYVLDTTLDIAVALACAACAYFFAQRTSVAP